MIFGLWLQVAPAAAQAPPPDSARRVVALPAVAVRASRRVLTLSPPGKARGLQDAFGHTIWPTHAVAVWHGPPDTSRLYVVRAVRVRLGSRSPETFADLPKRRRNFLEGRLQLRLSPVATDGGPAAEQNLLATPLVLTPESVGEQKGWLRIEVASQRLVLPARGLFIVAEGLTSDPTETYVRRRVLVHRVQGNAPEEYDFKKSRSKQDKGRRLYSYEELRRADGSTRLVEHHLFPALSHRSVETAADCHSWQRGKDRQQQPRWQRLPDFYASMRQHNPSSTMPDYNYELELEVEEL